MKLAVTVTTLVLFALACGSAAVKQQPLSGTVGGAAWTPVSGKVRTHDFANYADAGFRSLTIGDKALGCTSTLPSGGRFLFATALWRDGAVVEFGAPTRIDATESIVLAATLTSGSSNNAIATDGRLEIVTAPSTGQGKIRVRANADSSNTVEGEFDVDVCP